MKGVRDISDVFDIISNEQLQEILRNVVQMIDEETEENNEIHNLSDFKVGDEITHEDLFRLKYVFDSDEYYDDERNVYVEVSDDETTAVVFRIDTKHDENGDLPNPVVIEIIDFTENDQELIEPDDEPTDEEIEKNNVKFTCGENEYYIDGDSGNIVFNNDNLVFGTSNVDTIVVTAFNKKNPEQAPEVVTIDVDPSKIVMFNLNAYEDHQDISEENESKLNEPSFSSIKLDSETQERISNLIKTIEKEMK